jgi:bacillolysin
LSEEIFMRSRPLLAVLAAGLVCAATTVAVTGSPAVSSAPDPAAAPSGFFALAGDDAASFTLPSDVRVLRSVHLTGGRTQTRYQQYAAGAAVFSGQITMNRDAAGAAETVIGAYFPGIVAKNSRTITRNQARSIVRAQVGARGRYTTTYQLNPRTGRTFYQVDVMRAAQRPIRWVDAGNGRIVKSFSGLAHGEGVGVKGDTKTVDTTQNAGTGQYELLSADGRQITYDNQNRKATDVLMSDPDDVWNLLGNKSPAQQAGVDAHYYANVVDDFYMDTFSRNSIDGLGMQIKSVVHYGSRYCNAFWNGLYMTYGDGDGRTCLSLSGGLDVDGHELTHGVTEHTSALIYENQPGALNESFSDMMGNTIEFYADAHGLDPAAQPDWLIGEDVISSHSDPTPGFRNMADPAQDGDPDHMVELFTGTSDSGGVHTNSGIPNHVYYLTVNGGQNAGCTAGLWRTAPTHTEDCDVTVPALGLAEAEQIFFDGFTSLVPWANFCDARAATVASATARGSAQGTAVGLAWDAVGVHTGCTPGVQPPPPCVGDANASIPFESPHPYGNNGDCTWTYDNGTGGFAFHFSLLDTEKDFDYVYVKDGNGTVLATYTGNIRRGATSPCISTPTGSVQLVSDGGVTAQGFTVDAVKTC